jgi:hypothetical protein
MVGSHLFSFIFLEVDQAKFVILGEKAVGHIHDLAEHIKDVVPAAGSSRVSILLISN